MARLGIRLCDGPQSSIMIILAFPKEEHNDLRGYLPVWGRDNQTRWELCICLARVLALILEHESVAVSSPDATDQSEDAVHAQDDQRSHPEHRDPSSEADALRSTEEKH